MASEVFERAGLAPQAPQVANRPVSVLWADPYVEVGDVGEPDHFRDLNLDQVVGAVTAGREDYRLAKFFHAPLDSPEAVRFRQSVFLDIDGQPVEAALGRFGERMRSVRQRLEFLRRRHYALQRQAWFLETARDYCRAVCALSGDLDAADLRSEGLTKVRDHLARYVCSEAFTSLVTEAAAVQDAMAGVRYCLEIRDARVRVTRYDGEADYTGEVQDTFGRFRQGAVKSYLVDFRDEAQVNHVEAAVLELVARLYSAEFAALAGFYQGHQDFLEPAIARFDREVQFYLAYLDHIAVLRSAGLHLCYPSVSRSKRIAVEATFDLALADQLVRQRQPVVCNDLRLADAERLFVVTGPNQGGKTTFARTVGQLHHLAALGCPIPGRRARLFLCDRVFTHFDREEHLGDLRGKLEDDLIRIREVLDHATADSVVVMNEAFTSTTLADALSLGRRVLQRLIDLDVLGVYVTFVDELAEFAPSVVSMVAGVDEDDAAARTFRLERRPADGLAYAAAIARRHRLTRSDLAERLTP
jgi:DNA mismatch repair protein MutS